MTAVEFSRAAMDNDRRGAPGTFELIRSNRDGKLGVAKCPVGTPPRDVRGAEPSRGAEARSSGGIWCARIGFGDGASRRLPALALESSAFGRLDEVALAELIPPSRMAADVRQRRRNSADFAMSIWIGRWAARPKVLSGRRKVKSRVCSQGAIHAPGDAGIRFPYGVRQACSVRGT